MWGGPILGCILAIINIIIQQWGSSFIFYFIFINTSLKSMHYMLSKKIHALHCFNHRPKKYKFYLINNNYMDDQLCKSL